MCRTVAQQECGRVHSAQPARSRVTHDDCLHATDSVRADDLSVRHHRQLTFCGSAEASQARHHSRTTRTQDDEHTLAAPHSINGRSDGGILVAGHNEIDG
jgi:hypothetical protein